MTRRTNNSRDAERLLLVLAALTAVALVSTYLRNAAIYLLVAATFWFGWYLWRRKPSHTDVTLRFGVAFFIVALALILVRPYLNLGLS